MFRLTRASSLTATIASLGVLAGLIALFLSFVATTPRARLNIAQIAAIIFYIIVCIRVGRRIPVTPRYEDPQMDSISLPWMGAIFGTLVWTTMLNCYFISDDFPHLYTARAGAVNQLWSLFRYGQASTFLRPVGFASIFADYSIWGSWPVGFHATNLGLHLLSVAALFKLVRQLRGNWQVAAVTCGIFAAMPIQVESVAWMGARFDLLATSLALCSAVCYTWFRQTKNRSGYFLALAFYLLSLFSKESAFVLPVLIFAIEAMFFRARLSWRTAGFFAAGGAAFGYRLFALGGVGGYTSGGTSSIFDIGLKTFEGILLRGPAQALIGLNWTQPPDVLLITLASLTVAFLVVLAIYAQVGSVERSIIKLAFAWMIITMLPAHFLLMIGAGLTNSRVLYLPAIGVALLLGQLVMSVRSRRTRNLISVGLVTLYSLGVLHNVAAWRWTAQLSEDTLAQVTKLEPTPAPQTRFVFSNLPDTIRGVFFFHVGLTEGLRLAYNRDDITAIRDTELPAVSGPPLPAKQISLVWTGVPAALVVRGND